MSRLDDAPYRVAENGYHLARTNPNLSLDKSRKHSSKAVEKRMPQEARTGRRQTPSLQEVRSEAEQSDKADT